MSVEGLYPGMKGGKKGQWLNEHRTLVLDYFEEFGEKATLQQFNMMTGTLYRLVNGPRWDNRPSLPRKDDRALIKSEIAMARVERVTKEFRYEKQQDDSVATVTFTLKLGSSKVKQLLQDIIKE